jgi:hypothetical protein
MALRIGVGSAATRSAERLIAERGRRARTCGWLVAIALAFALGGCGLAGESNTSFLVDPTRYDGYRCNDLVAQWNALVARKKELESLMDKAGDGGGAIIGAMTYRTDYQTVLDEQRILQLTAAEKKCALTPTYQSDQIIR